MLVRIVIGALLMVAVVAMAFTGVDKFTGAENHNITLEEASALVGNYQIVNPEAAKSHFFGRNAIEKILAQDGVVGVRVYYGIADDGVQHLVMVGTDSDQNDLVKGVLAERAPKCPPYCGEENELNTPQQTTGKIAVR